MHWLQRTLEACSLLLAGAADADAAAGTNSLASGLSGRGTDPVAAEVVGHVGARCTTGNCERSSGGWRGQGDGLRRRAAAPSPCTGRPTRAGLLTTKVPCGVVTGRCTQHRAPAAIAACALRQAASAASLEAPVSASRSIQNGWWRYAAVEAVGGGPVSWTGRQGGGGSAAAASSGEAPFGSELAKALQRRAPADEPPAAAGGE